MTKNKIVFLAILAIIVLFFGAWGFGLFDNKNINAKEKTTLKYIVNNLGSITPIDIALEKGFFEEVGLNIETVGVAGGGGPSVEAILSKNADIGGAATPTYINSIKAGGKLKVIYGGGAMAHAKDPGYQWIVREDSDIKTAKDLSGKTIAIGARGAMWEYGTREYLKQAGLSIDQVTLLLVPPPQYEQVLRSGQVDVVVASSPFSDKILEGGGTRVVTNLFDVLGEKIGGGGYGYIVRQDLIDKKPDVVKKLVAVYVKADQWAEANPEEARKVVAEILKKRNQNPDMAKYWKAPHLRDYGLWTDADVQFWLEWFVKDKKIKEGELKPSHVYTNEFNPYYKNN